MLTKVDDPCSNRTSEGERAVTVHAQKGSTVAITVEEKHYHFPEWLTPALIVKMAKIFQEGGDGV